MLNVARGGIINEQAFLDNLNSGKVVGGATTYGAKNRPSPTRSDSYRLQITGGHPRIRGPYLRGPVNVAIDFPRKSSKLDG
jgi:lactate dehydrogenase-like 2-hydroxyacid dehydrogenase